MNSLLSGFCRNAERFPSAKGGVSLKPKYLACIANVWICERFEPRSHSKVESQSELYHVIQLTLTLKLTTAQLPHRLSKRQSPSTTTVLFRTTFTQTIKYNSLWLWRMTTAQVVETSVTVNNNSPIQDYVHPRTIKLNLLLKRLKR